MRVLKVLTRAYTNDLAEVISFYEKLQGQKANLPFKYEKYNLEIAAVGNVLLICGRDEDIKPFRDTNATFLVDSIEEFACFLRENNAIILDGPKEVPTGKNMTVRHPDGLVIEYVEHYQSKMAKKEGD